MREPTVTPPKEPLLDAWDYMGIISLALLGLFALAKAFQLI